MLYNSTNAYIYKLRNKDSVSAYDPYKETLTKRYLPLTELQKTYNMRNMEVEPRLKDGGMFLRFDYDVVENQHKQALESIAWEVETYINQEQSLFSKISVISLLNLQRVHAYPVKGEPFFEDIQEVIPSARVRIDFAEGAPIKEEKLYSELRTFGVIANITMYDKYAIVQFKRTRSATSAKHCIHGERIDSTKILIRYERSPVWCACEAR